MIAVNIQTFKKRKKRITSFHSTKERCAINNINLFIIYSFVPICKKKRYEKKDKIQSTHN